MGEIRNALTKPEKKKTTRARLFDDDEVILQKAQEFLFWRRRHPKYVERQRELERLGENLGRRAQCFVP